MTRAWRSLPAAALVVSIACAPAPRHEPHFLPVVVSAIPLPPGYGAPVTPADNPLTVAKAGLGRQLFDYRRLSYNGAQSCASCHQQRLAFTDGRPHAVGSTGAVHYRNTMGLANAGYRRPLTWADPGMETLEQQVLVPLTNQDPVELGMSGHFDELLSRIRSDGRYVRLFSVAFPEEREPITIGNVARALASFERTLISAGSPYDRFVRYGDSQALPAAAWRGMRLFFSARLACSTCHGGRDLGTPSKAPPFANNGTYATYPTRNGGLINKTGRRGDMGRFRVPSLGNVAETPTYWHERIAETLSDVIDDYEAGGRAARAGHGKLARGSAVKAFTLTPDEKGDLLAFLASLTDDAFLADPRFGDPWIDERPAAGAAAAPGEWPGMRP